jgi:hypothetical protein
LPCCFIYIDDVLVASVSHEQQLKDLQQVLERFQQHGLVLNMEKCEVGVRELDYLGHHITPTGIRPIISRVEAMEKYLQPVTVSGRIQVLFNVH